MRLFSLVNGLWKEMFLCAWDILMIFHGFRVSKKITCFFFRVYSQRHNLSHLNNIQKAIRELYHVSQIDSESKSKTRWEAWNLSNPSIPYSTPQLLPSPPPPHNSIHFHLPLQQVPTPPDYKWHLTCVSLMAARSPRRLSPNKAILYNLSHTSRRATQ